MTSLTMGVRVGVGAGTGGGSVRAGPARASTSGVRMGARGRTGRRGVGPTAGRRGGVAAGGGAGAEEGSITSLAELGAVLERAAEAEVGGPDVASAVGALRALEASGAISKWGALGRTKQYVRGTSLADLKSAGLQNPELLAVPSNADLQNFLFKVVAGVSVAAVAAGFLPGDWGYFGQYFTGSLALVVLAVGSTAPGLLEVAIDRVNRLDAGYRRRLYRHEAAHFLVGYLYGLPVVGYSMGTPTARTPHVEFAEFQYGRRLRGALAEGELERLAVTAMSGIAAEGLEFERVQGGAADLLELQRTMDRQEPKLSAGDQQKLTRWAVREAALALRREASAYDALTAAMERGDPVDACIRVIEANAVAAAPTTD